MFYGGAIIIALLFVKAYWNKYRTKIFFIYAMCVMACALQSLAAISPNLFRLALPYTPFLMILLPNTSNSIHNYQRRLYYNYAVWVWHIAYVFITLNQPFEFASY